MQIKPLIDVQNLFLKKNGNLILEDLTFQIQKGEYVGILGPNGAGKTSLLRILTGLEKENSGSMQINGTLAYVPQMLPGEDFPLPITVKEILLFAAPQAYKQKHLLDALEEVGLQHLMDRQIQSLSGGERQRVFLARALLSKPDLLLLDEPLSAVDQHSEAEFHVLLRHLNKKGMAIVMVSHDLEMVSKEASKVLCLNRKICENCHPMDLDEKAWARVFGAHVKPIHHHDHA